MPKKYPEKKPPLAQYPREAVKKYFDLRKDPHIVGLAADTPDLRGLHIGLAVLTRYQVRRGHFGHHALVQRIVGPAPERPLKHYDLDILIASSAVELACYQRGSLFQRVRWPCDNRFLHLTELGEKEPYRQIARTAVLQARENLVDQLSLDHNLEDTDGLVNCAQVIGEAIVSSQQLSETLEKPEEI